MIICPFKDLSRYAPVIPGLEDALNVVNALENLDPKTVELSGGNRFFIQQVTSRSAEGATFEAHRNYLDVQYILEGVPKISSSSKPFIPLLCTSQMMYLQHSSMLLLGLANKGAKSSSVAARYSK